MSFPVLYIELKYVSGIRICCSILMVAQLVISSTTSAQTPALADTTFYIQQGTKLIGTDFAGSAMQGYSVSISADGNTALVGAPSDNSSQGAAWVYTRSEGKWSQQGTKLTGTGAIGAALIGWSVALSADGNTAILGGYADNSAQGAAWVFTRKNGVWSQQGNKLVGTGNKTAAQQGWSVSISADGNTALIGGYADHNNLGAAWVFIRTNGEWIQQGAKLLGNGTNIASQQGYSVSISGDGNTALVGGYTDNAGKGAAWIYTRVEGAWSQQGPKLTVSDATGPAFLGRSVSLSADGNTALIGGFRDNSFQGAAWVFTRKGSTWTQQGNKLVGSGNSGAARQGWSVALAADGNSAIIGGFYDSTGQGAAWVFTRSGNSWVQKGAKLTGNGNTGNANIGHSISLSGDGTEAIIGGNLDNAAQGAAWIFRYVPPVSKPVAQTITFNPLPTKTYGDSAFVLSASASSGLPVKYSSNNPAVAIIQSGKIHIKGAGTTEITALQEGDTKYAASPAIKQTFVVNKADLLISTSDKTKKAGTENPVFDLKYAGFLNSDSSSILKTTPIITTTASIHSPAGKYPITLTGASADHYTIRYQNGTLTVIADTPSTVPVPVVPIVPVVPAAPAEPAIPTKPAEPANPEKLVEPTTPSKPAEPATPEKPTTPVQPAEPTTPAKPAEPTTPAKPAEPAAPEKPAEPTTPAKPAEPATPAKPAEPATPAKPAEPDAPAKPAEPDAPEKPAEPAAPEKPAEPTTPAKPAEPATPAKPAEPATPTKPAEPATPAKPAEPGAPEKPAEPTTPAKPAEPATPAKPAEPAAPEKPAEPTTPAKPAEPANPEKPAEPTTPAKPSEQVTPAKPGEPTTPTKPAEPAAPEKPAEPTTPEKPAEPTTPTQPAEPATPAEPITPVQPAEPTTTKTEPAKPAEPTIPAEPTSPAEPATPIVPTEPITPVAPDEPVTPVVDEEPVAPVAPTVPVLPNEPPLPGAPAFPLTPDDPAAPLFPAAPFTLTQQSLITAPVKPALEINNVMSPNGDGKNDYLIIKNLDLYPNNTIKIIDRAGRERFVKHNYGNDWEGTFRGSPLPEDTYYYIVDLGPGNKPVKGFVSIVR